MAFLLYDDILHLGQACQASRTFGATYRPFVYWITCQLGGDPVHVSLFSAVCLAFSALLLSRFWLGLKGQSLVRSSIALWHPLVLFPVFYASQISTAITALWLSLMLTLIAIRANFTSIFCLFLLAITAQYLREESILLLFIFGAVWFSYRLFFSKNENLKPVFLKWFVACGFGGFLFPKFIAKQASFFGLADTPNLLNSALQGGVDYPIQLWFSMQLHALKYYLLSYLMPIYGPFFGDWTSWYRFHQESDRIQIVWAATAWFLVGAFVLFYFRKRNRFLASVIFSILIFCAFTFAQSLNMRSDWFILSRATLPALLALMILIDGAWRFSSKAKKIVSALFIVSIGSTLFHTFFHYRNRDVFLRYEAKVSQNSPSFHMAQADQLKFRHADEEALREYFTAYKMIPIDFAPDGSQGRQYKTLALYHGYHLSKKLGDEHSSETAFRTLMKYDSFFSWMLCLQSQQYAATECVSFENKKKFCSLASSPMNRAYVQADLKTIETKVDEICGVTTNR